MPAAGGIGHRPDGGLGARRGDSTQIRRDCRAHCVHDASRSAQGAEGGGRAVRERVCRVRRSLARADVPHAVGCAEISPRCARAAPEMCASCARDAREMPPPNRHPRPFERSDDRLAARSRSRRDLRREIASRGGRCGGGRRRRLVAGAHSAILPRLSAIFALDLSAIYPRLSAILGAAGRAALGGRGARRDASGG